MPLSPIPDERFDWKPWTIGRTPRGDTLVYDILSRLPGLLQSGEWTNIKLASTLTVINVFGNYSAVSADLKDTTLHVCVVLCWTVFLCLCNLSVGQNCACLNDLEAKHLWQQVMTFPLLSLPTRMDKQTETAEMWGTLQSSGECSFFLCYNKFCFKSSYLYFNILKVFSEEK